MLGRPRSSVPVPVIGAGFDTWGGSPFVQQRLALLGKTVFLLAGGFFTVINIVMLAGGGLAMMGTPKMIADQMEEWLITEASDGFNVMFPYLPGGLDDFVDKVVPELQRRGLFRTEYEGKTLRENLGLPRPENRFFAETAKAAE